MGIIVPRDASAALESRSMLAIMELIPMAPLDSISQRSPADSTAITLLIDPTVKHAFRQLVQASVSAIINELSAELSTNSRQLGRVLQMLEESPQSLIFGPQKASPGPGEPGYVAPVHAKEQR